MQQKCEYKWQSWGWLQFLLMDYLMGLRIQVSLSLHFWDMKRAQDKTLMPNFQVSMAHCEWQNSLCCSMCIGWACAIFLHDKHGDSFIVQLVEGALPALSYINLFFGPDWVVQNCTLLVWSGHCLPVLQIVILMWTGNNVTRPLRVAGAAVLAPFIDKFLKKTQKVLNLPNQAFAFMIVVASFASLCLSVVGVLILSRWGK